MEDGDLDLAAGAVPLGMSIVLLFQQFDLLQLNMDAILMIDDRNNEQHLGSTINGTELLTSTLLSFLSSNASSSSNLGCGAVELVHPLQGH